MQKICCALLVFFISILLPMTVLANEYSESLPSGLKYSEIEKSVDAYALENENTTAALSVAIFSGDEVLFEKAYGYFDIENSVKNNSNAVFEWGSCTKLLVWVSVMQLVEKGVLDLDKDIRMYLPEGFLTKLRYDDPITLTNLMNHNAGWQETVTELFHEDKKDVRELKDALKVIEPEQVHKPGTIVAYSNWGTALAGYIVEYISGQSFHGYVQEHIFEPLNMNHTAINSTLSDNQWVFEKRALQKCYTTENKSLGTCLYYISLYPAGMAVGTLSDFVKFAQAFIPSKGERSLIFEKSETLNQMLSPSLYYADGKTGRNYHGFWTDELSVPVLWHNGGTIGSTSWFTLDKASGIGMVTLTNQSYESVYNCGLLPLVYGNYKSESVSNSEEDNDISGVYVSSRTCFKGYAKLYNIVCHMQFDPKVDGSYSVPGTNNTLTDIGSKKYLMTMGSLKQYIVYNGITEDNQSVLQMPGIDYIKVNGYGLLAKYALLIMFIIAALYSIIELIDSIVGLIKPQKVLHPMRGYRNIVHLSVVISLGIFVYITMNLFSNVPMFNTVQWSIALNAILSLVPIVNIIVFLLKSRTINLKKKEKIKLILTCIAGLIMTANVVYWDGYIFW